MNFIIGWPMPIRWVRWIIGLPAVVTLLAAMAQAEPRGAAGLPDADFLEFLGSWNPGGDHPAWVDPFQLDDPVLTDADQPNATPSQPQRRSEPKRSGTDDDRTKWPTPYAVRPEGGVRP